jgi:hypothetical protein
MGRTVGTHRFAGRSNQWEAGPVVCPLHRVQLRVGIRRPRRHGVG